MSRNLRNSGAWGYQTEDVSSSVSTTIKGNHREQTLLQLNKEIIMHNRLTSNTFIQNEIEKLNKMGTNNRCSFDHNSMHSRFYVCVI